MNAWYTQVCERGEISTNELDQLASVYKPDKHAWGKRIPGLNECFTKVELKQSAIHGRGVFASKLIKYGEPITMYPADALIEDLGSGKVKYYSKEEEDIHVFDDYLIRFTGNVSIAGNPRIVDNTAYLGHMINHAESPNATFMRIKCFLITISLRDIPVGEEILVNYGPVFFPSRAGIAAARSDGCMACLKPVTFWCRRCPVKAGYCSKQCQNGHWEHGGHKLEHTKY